MVNKIHQEITENILEQMQNKLTEWLI